MNFTGDSYPKSDLKKMLGHIVCWSLLIFYELTVLVHINGQLEPFYIYPVFYAINISFFYAHAQLLSFVFYRPKKAYFQGAMGYILLVTLYFCVKSLADYLLDAHQPPIRDPLIYIQGFLARNVIRMGYFTMLATFYWFAGYVSYAEKRKAEAERRQWLAEKEKSELAIALERSRNAYLQQQINPHLLFNTLNFVYNSVQKHSDDAAQCVWLLAEIMRFSLEETGPDGKIELSREAEQIEHLLAINRYRYQNPIRVNLSMEGDFKNVRIIPLILLTLTENIFKHGQLHDQDQPAAVHIKLYPDGRLRYYSRNAKKSKNEQRRRPPVGLQNVRIRLDAAYAGNYELVIAEPGDLYELSLTLNLCT